MEEYIKQLEEENFNLRQDILLNKISFPPKWTKDKTIYELYDMPTYDDLTNIVNKIKDYVKDNSSKNYVHLNDIKEILNYKKERRTTPVETIEYRGKVADEPNEWIYGYLTSENSIYQPKENKYSKCCGFGSFSVIPESIGVYTGCRDVNNIKIFENDIVKYEDNFYTIKYLHAAFVLVDDNNNEKYLLRDITVEVIGNSFRLNTNE